MLGDSLRRRHGADSEPRPEAGQPPRRRGPRKRSGGGLWFPWWQWVLAGVVVLLVSFAVGFLLSTQVLFPRPETAGTGIPVPSLYGENRADAEAALREAGLNPGEVVGLASLETRPGRVLAQDPVPGQQLRRGATVSFAVSTGPPELRVPPVQGMTPRSARELLEEVGFDVEVRQVRSDGVSEEVVVATEPAAGVARTLPSVVTLLVNEVVASDTLGPPAPGEPFPGEAAPGEGAGEGVPPEGARPGSRPPDGRS